MYTNDGLTDTELSELGGSRPADGASDDVSDAFRHWQETGEVTQELRREFEEPQDRSDPLERPVSPKIQQLLDHHVHALQNERIRSGRLEERLDLMMQAVNGGPLNQEPQPAPEQRQPWQIRDETTDVIGAVGDLRQLANSLLADRREAAEHNAYNRSMARRETKDPNFGPDIRNG